MATTDPKLAIDIAVQTIILLIGLSASIITFTSTFTQSSSQKKVTCWEKTSWILMIVSIACGVLALLKIIGNIDAGHIEIYEIWTCIFAGAQIFVFGAGLISLVLMAAKK